MADGDAMVMVDRGDELGDGDLSSYESRLDSYIGYPFHLIIFLYKHVLGRGTMKRKALKPPTDSSHLSLHVHIPPP